VLRQYCSECRRIKICCGCFRPMIGYFISKNEIFSKRVFLLNFWILSDFKRIYIFSRFRIKNTDTRSLESFSYLLRSRVTLYFKGALFSIQRCIQSISYENLKNLEKSFFFTLCIFFSVLLHLKIAHFRITK